VALTRHDIDWKVLATCALVTLAVTLPPVWVIRIMKGDDLAGSESNLWFVGPMAIVIGFAVGGSLAARRRPGTPLLHSAGSGALAYAVIAVVTVVRRASTGAGVAILSLLLLGQIAISIALLAGYMTMRRTAREVTE